jgi:hypothetical protein
VIRKLKEHSQALKEQTRILNDIQIRYGSSTPANSYQSTALSIEGIPTLPLANAVEFEQLRSNSRQINVFGASKFTLILWILQ